MLVVEIVENYKQVWARSGSGVKRKYRCTSGQKKGRVVAKPSTCSTPTKQSTSQRTKKTRTVKGTKQSIARARTIKRATSRRVTKLNKSTANRKRIRPRKRDKK